MRQTMAHVRSGNSLSRISGGIVSTFVSITPWNIRPFGLDIQPFFDIRWIISGEMTILGPQALRVFT
jgi:hypothetical protein